MATRIQEELEAQAILSRTWTLLFDPKAVTPCPPEGRLSAMAETVPCSPGIWSRSGWLRAPQGHPELRSG